jgi:hypothetical protein
MKIVTGIKSRLFLDESNIIDQIVFTYTIVYIYFHSKFVQKGRGGG